MFDRMIVAQCSWERRRPSVVLWFVYRIKKTQPIPKNLEYNIFPVLESAILMLLLWRLSKYLDWWGISAFQDRWTPLLSTRLESAKVQRSAFFFCRYCLSCLKPSAVTSVGFWWRQAGEKKKKQEYQWKTSKKLDVIPLVCLKRSRKGLHVRLKNSTVVKATNWADGRGNKSSFSLTFFMALRINRLEDTHAHTESSTFRSQTTTQDQQVRVHSLEPRQKETGRDITIPHFPVMQSIFYCVSRYMNDSWEWLMSLDFFLLGF